MLLKQGEPNGQRNLDLNGNTRHSQPMIEQDDVAVSASSARKPASSNPFGWSAIGYAIAVAAAATPGSLIAYFWIFPGVHVSNWVVLGRAGLMIVSQMICLPIIYWLAKRFHTRA